jgi:hypothetical protein
LIEVSQDIRDVRNRLCSNGEFREEEDPFDEKNLLLLGFPIQEP